MTLNIIGYDKLYTAFYYVVSLQVYFQCKHTFYINDVHVFVKQIQFSQLYVIYYVVRYL